MTETSDRALLAEPSMPRVLIVDDDRFDRMQIVRALERANLPVRCDEAASLAEARQKLMAAIYDVILLDHHLPDGHGAAFAADLRREGLSHGAKIHMITTCPQAAEAGAMTPPPWDCMIDKADFSANRLRDALTRAAGTTSARSAASEDIESFLLEHFRTDPSATFEALDRVQDKLWTQVTGEAG